MADFNQSLSRVPIFAGLGKKELKKLAERMNERTFKEGDTITEQGQRGVGFFVIEEGDATVSIGGDLVRTLGPGHWFGEIAMIDDKPRSATIVAATDLHCRGLAVWEFRPFVQEHPEVAWPLLETLAARLREAEARAS
ncbi:MAG: cyclic nucleotide-binding domain-containing protein [Actinomycetota bacterium]|nr:cyclic nucleotide-binding domain-containing protein [Actinomycetota bacterium]